MLGPAERSTGTMSTITDHSIDRSTSHTTPGPKARRRHRTGLTTPEAGVLVRRATSGDRSQSRRETPRSTARVPAIHDAASARYFKESPLSFRVCILCACLV